MSIDMLVRQWARWTTLVGSSFFTLLIGAGLGRRGANHGHQFQL